LAGRGYHRESGREEKVEGKGGFLGNEISVNCYASESLALMDLGGKYLYKSAQFRAGFRLNY